jgi:hypothetical protein
MVRALLKTASILFATLSLATFAHAQAERYDALANSAMFENRPTPETSKLLKDELLFQRATQTYLWALEHVRGYDAWSPGMISQISGKGAKYMVAFTDRAGTPLSGGAGYRVKFPPNVPAENFWSLTLYEAENSSGYANGQPFPSLGSRDKPEQNADGSTELYLGPTAPSGKERNWMKTIPG